MSRQAIALAAALSGAVAMTPAAAQEDDRAVKPEVMLLLDTSGSMQAPATGAALGGCVAGNAVAPPEGNAGVLTRMNLIKQALAGTPNPSTQSACRAEAAPANGYVAAALAGDASATNTRQLCCDRLIGRSCLDWRPCAADGDPAVAVSVDPERAIRRDGLIHQNEDRIKFGMMAFDHDPRQPGSYGSEHVALQVPGAVSAQGQILAPGVASPNLGARPPTAGPVPTPGDLIPGSRGVINDGVRHPETVVGEDADSVRRHNAYVMDQLRSVVPSGPSPLAPLLRDLEYYYSQQQNGPAGTRDDAYACRRRVAVLVTDGGSSQFYEDQERVDPDACELACEADGYPYDSSETYAAQLAARGVPLYVIGFGAGADEAKARSIARAAAIEAGRADETGYFFLADDRESLSAAFIRIGNQVLAGLRAKTRPLVVTPGAGDVDFDETLADVRQVRLASFTEVDDGEAADRYGRIQARRYACEPTGNGGAALGQTGDAVDFDDVLAAQAGRNAVGANPGDGGVVQVVGGEGALFDESGNINPGNVIDDDALRDLFDSPIGEDGDDGDLEDAVDVVEGFFGGEGISEGEGEPARAARQLGEIYDGDIVAFPPPTLVAENPAWQAYLGARRLRPTLIVAGARDGQIHVFRLADGRELFTFVPRLSFGDLEAGADSPGDGALNADGPLTVGEVVRCRSLGEGQQDCPADDGALEFHSMIVGGLGGGGANLFGVDISEATALLRLPDPFGRIDGDDLRAWDVINAAGVTGLDAFGAPTRDEPQLGLTVSRPLLTHVRTDSRVRGAVIVGCGEDRTPGGGDAPDRLEGRCVLVLDAVTGEVIRRFTPASGVVGGVAMDSPMIGSPAGYPSGGLQPATRAFIGDRKGRLWRMDLRAADPADWEMRVVWPPAQAADARGYTVGRPVVDRPSLTVREDGRLVVVFGTGDDPRPADRRAGAFPAAHVVSFTEAVSLTADAVDFGTTTNWVLPLRAEEHLTGAPVTFDAVTYFTTIEAGAGACANPLGRMYGVHSFRAVEDPYRTGDGRELDVQAALPTLLTGQGAVSGALAIRMPTGRVAYGVTVATVPSCGDDAAATAQLVLNLADGATDPDEPVDSTGMRAEMPEGQVVESELDETLFESDGTQLAMNLNGLDANGNPIGFGGIGSGPFSGWRVLYWGSTFAR